MNFTRHLVALHSKGYSVRATVTALVAAILLPPMLLGGWLVYQAAVSERALLEREAETQARGLTALIDHEIVSIKNILAALASAHDLQTGNFEAFYQQVAELARQLGFLIVLSDPDRNEQILNTSAPWGSPHQPIPPARREVQDRVGPGEIAISNVFYGPITRQQLIAAVTPVMRDGRAAYFLSVGVPTRRFAEFLHNTAPPFDWVISIVDRNNVVVARSQRNDEFSGMRVTGDFASVASNTGGVYRGNDRLGVLTQWTYQRSEATGWFVTVAVPQSMLDAPAWRALLGYSTAGGLLFVFALALTYHLADGLSHSIGALGIDRQPTREEFAVLFESGPNGVVVVDSRGTIVLANARMAQQFGYTHDELIGRQIETLIPQRFRHRPLGEAHDLRGLHRNASEFPIEIGINPIRTRSGYFVMATVQDMTARQHAQDRLTAALGERDELRRRFMQAQEEERLRLAHELHDQTGQSVAAAMLELKGMEAMVTGDGRDRLRALRKQLEEMGKTLHRVAWQLRPASIDELGLTSALANYVSEWSASTGIETDFHCRDTALDTLPDEVRTTLYRVVQESLTNIAKHAAGAANVSIVVGRSEGALRLIVEDDGKGFDPASPDRRSNGGPDGGLGLAGMRERLALIGGALEVESSAGAGTTLFASMPVEPEPVPA